MEEHQHEAKKLDFNGSLKAIQARKRSVYPTERHELAMEIAVYFKEPYTNWVRFIKGSKKYPALIRNKFKELKDFKKYKRADKIKALMAYIQK